MLEKLMLRLGWVRVATMTSAVEEVAVAESRERAQRREAERRARFEAESAEITRSKLCGERRVVAALLTELVGVRHA